MSNEDNQRAVRFTSLKLMTEVRDKLRLLKKELGFVNYNYARPHLSLKGKTPAEVAGVTVKGWKQLIENAIQTETREEKANPEGITVAPVQVVRE
jgi:hypothetical protein